jgi:hypothetical protein
MENKIVKYERLGDNLFNVYLKNGTVMQVVPKSYNKIKTELTLEQDVAKKLYFKLYKMASKGVTIEPVKTFEYRGKYNLLCA